MDAHNSKGVSKTLCKLHIQLFFYTTPLRVSEKSIFQHDVAFNTKSAKQNRVHILSLKVELYRDRLGVSDYFYLPLYSTINVLPASLFCIIRSESLLSPLFLVFKIPFIDPLCSLVLVVLPEVRERSQATTTTASTIINN